MTHHSSIAHCSCHAHPEPTSDGATYRQHVLGLLADSDKCRERLSLVLSTHVQPISQAAVELLGSLLAYERCEGGGGGTLCFIAQCEGRARELGWTYCCCSCCCV